MANEFPSNSNKRRAEDPPESVVVNKVVSGKKPLGRRMKDMFFAGDGRSAAQGVFAEVILPQVKDLLAEAIKDMVERVIFDDRTPKAGNRYRRPGAPTNYTSYGNRYSGRTHTASRKTPEEGPNARLRRDDIEYIVLTTRAEADEVLTQMDERIERYESASIADLKSLIGWSSDLKDQDWGWVDLSSARVIKNRDGFVLDLPKYEPL